MRDSELAASIVDGDPGALAEAYDKYADLLWSYCRSLVSDADHAAQAVTDTFVIAASKLDVLPTFGRLRAWLYAVARNECLRRQRTAKGAIVPYGGAERLRRAAEVLSTGEQRQLRALLTAAFDGLDDAERDVMQMVWHGLDLAEVAAVLGITRSDAYALFTRARDQLEASVGVLLMGWSGRGGCDEFEDTLYGRDSKLTAEMRARLGRHIAKCAVCTEQYRRQMRPSLMMCLSVGALLSESADARAAASRAPIGLWEQVYQMTSEQNPEARWHKILGSRRMSFGPDGFPRQMARDGMGKAPLKVAAVGTVAVAATATGLATHGHFAAQPDASASPSSHGISAVAPDASSATPAPSGTHAGTPSAKAHTTHKAAHAKPSATRSGASSPSASPSALPVAGSSAVPVSASATPSSGGGSGTTSSPAPTGSGSGSSSGSGSGGSGSTTPTAGTLSVSKSSIPLSLGSGSFTLTADGGPVSWSVSEPTGIALSQDSGTLQAGQSVTIKVTETQLLNANQTLVISPGSETVTVDLGLGL